MTIQSYNREGLTILRINGRFDVHIVKEIASWLDQVVKTSPQPQILINLQEVHFIDSAALAVLVGGFKQAQKKEGQFCVCDLQQPVRIILEITGLDKAFPIFENEDIAIETMEQFKVVPA